MASKLLLLGLVLVATTVLILSEVSARDISEETEAKSKEGVVEDAKQYGGRYGGYPGRGYGGYPGGGYGGYPRGGYGGYPGGGYYPPWRRPYPCRWGCCGRGWNGGCRCCAYPTEIPDAGLQPEP